jgi:hypothetical protein
MHKFHFRHARRTGSAPRRRVSYANVAATLALVFAIGGGTAWATQHYVVTSTSQIKPSVLKALHGANGKNGTNGTNGTNGAAGPQGAQGAQGAAGANGTNGTNGATNVTEQVYTGTIPAYSVYTATVYCPAGTKATGGGGADQADDTAVIFQDAPYPAPATSGQTPTGWSVSWSTGADQINVAAYVICASP